jgi:thiamine kinase-like enzyme
MYADIRALLEHFPQFRGTTPTIEPLPGGLTNRIYKIGDYVLRVFSPGTELLGINRERELACLQAIAAAGLGAEVMAYLPDVQPPPFEGFSGALLVRYLAGNLLTEERVQDLAILRRIGATLKQCHMAPIADSVAEFNVFHVVRDYLEKSRSRRVVLPAECGAALATLQRIENAMRTESPCLCHNDLLAANFVDDGQTLRLIDWEYGGRGNRFFDLGNFAANLQLTDDQEKSLLQAYFGVVRPEDVRRLKLMGLASDLRESSWGYLQSALSTLHTPQYYLDYGRRHLERFLRTARTLDV